MEDEIISLVNLLTKYGASFCLLHCNSTYPAPFDGLNLNYIKHLKEITDCPVLINTSFNIRGEPIVCTVKDAFKCFMGTDLDILVIEDFILFKKEQDQSLIKDYKNKFELD